jgi:hypothetical protein
MRGRRERSLPSPRLGVESSCASGEPVDECLALLNANCKAPR